ncbi:MAG TPA: TlpA disulfide reductase family protein [Solimonas sp.]|nr:TlpA disulfide reductase family protein [Solimonas sp.]
MKPVRQTVFLLALSLLAAAGGYWAAHGLFTGQDVQAGEPAPAFSLKDLAGQTRTLAEFRGKLVLVNFWASWCAPCVAELPLLVEAQARFAARGLQVIGPALDEPAGVQPFVGRFGINYPVMADFSGAEALARELGNSQGALPYSVLISRDGRVLEVILGGLKREELRALVEEYIGA